ncbi:MAG: hypothetical protein ILM98_15065 [Kiritimatiellae bacterium]|nr:hypothetical protein [Kiritimatiellia bacterium]
MGLPRIFQSAGGGFPIWCAEAKPHGMDADAWRLRQCGRIEAVGPRSGAGHQFPCFGAVAP